MGGGAAIDYDREDNGEPWLDSLEAMKGLRQKIMNSWGNYEIKMASEVMTERRCSLRLR